MIARFILGLRWWPVVARVAKAIPWQVLRTALVLERFGNRYLYRLMVVGLGEARGGRSNGQSKEAFCLCAPADGRVLRTELASARDKLAPVGLLSGLWMSD